uniref:Uncharacterized protein n=1 Tax=Triticum urartu TaxID=4572 RepID=A0A8R7QI68_TRIUA
DLADGLLCATSSSPTTPAHTSRPPPPATRRLRHPRRCLSCNERRSSLHTRVAFKTTCAAWEPLAETASCCLYQLALPSRAPSISC